MLNINDHGSDCGKNAEVDRVERISGNQKLKTQEIQRRNRTE